MGSGRIFLSHESASKYWAHHDLYETEETRSVPREDDVPDDFMLADVRRLLVDVDEGEVLHVALASPAQKRADVVCMPHCRHVAFPGKSFRRIEPGVMVAVPELCFLEAARSLELLPLILYGFELCGTYACCADRVRFDREPLTSVNKIEAYLNRSARVQGIKKARWALRYVLDGSRSPWESALALMMALPVNLGGYGLPAPQMNYGIPVDLLNKIRPGEQLVLHGDVVWTEAHLIAEYDGEQHDEPANSASDKQRDHALLDAGYEVVRITKRQIHSGIEMHRLARTINRKGHCHKPKTNFEPDSRRDVAQDVLLGCSDRPWWMAE